MNIGKKPTEQEMEADDMRKATSHLLKGLEEERTALAIANAKEDAMLASIGDVIIATDKTWKITVMNTAAKEMLGWTAEEVIGKDLFKTLVVEDKEGIIITSNERPIRTVLESGEAVVMNPVFYVGKNRKKVPVAVNIRPIVLGGEIIGTINAFRDITKERELDLAKSEFISLASHQLRTPVTAMGWNLEMLIDESKGPLNEDQKKTLERIYESNKNMIELVGGFLDVAKMESTGFDIEKGDVDILQIADSVLEGLINIITDKKIAIIKKYGDTIPHLDIGTRTARVILQNLLTNAVKYTPHSGSVEITITKSSEEISISIKDNGYGIPEVAKDKIFTKLFRADNIKEKEPSGTGLGLYLVKSLMDKLGGKVWFESKESEGTTFYVTLKQDRIG